MNREAALLAKCTARGLVPNGEGFGGRPGIVAADVAAALGMGNLRRECGLALLARYCLDAHATVDLIGCVRAQVRHECARQCVSVGGKRAARLAVLVVKLYLSDGSVPMQERAQVAGLHRNKYVNYEPCVAAALRAVHEWDSVGCHHLARQFSRKLAA